MSLGWAIRHALDVGAAAIKPTIATCGTCPVNIACAVGRGGNGWTFPCCSMTSVEVPIPNEVPTLLIVDCQLHQFERREMGEHEIDHCPLCKSGIVESDLRDWGGRWRWLPTVHAAVSVPDRIDAWRRALPEARKRVERDAKIRECGKVTR